MRTVEAHHKETLHDRTDRDSIPRQRRSPL
jgi:hypothetical protein